MKKHITRNNIHGVKIAVPYCKLQNTLKFYESDLLGYACGLYGWNYDAYRIGSVNILTGYRCEGRRADSKALDIIEKTARRLIDGGALDNISKLIKAREILTPLIEAL